MLNRLIVPLSILSALAACSTAPEAPATTGASDYAAYCAACHGAGGKGDGIRSASLDPAPPDLTSIAARNGGTFPRAKVMTQIWGYARATPTPGMPAYATLLAGDTVLYDSGDGILTPTPLRLVELMEYVQGL
ncbi:c-type cytochrome [Phaeovulum sp.]|uniref:c-type cytochrome n=1 Tax=Phaeovulum sp. TaxID=2934796 RepID=UPI003563043E